MSRFSIRTHIKLDRYRRNVILLNEKFCRNSLGPLRGKMCERTDRERQTDRQTSLFTSCKIVSNFLFLATPVITCNTSSYIKFFVHLYEMVDLLPLLR